MKHLTLAAIAAAGAMALSGCMETSPPLDRADARYDALLTMNVPEFYGTIAVASLVSVECDGLTRNPRIDFEINERRNERGNGSFSALRQRDAIQSTQTSMRQAFQAQHGSNLCNVAQRDVVQATKPYTYLLESAASAS